MKRTLVKAGPSISLCVALTSFIFAPVCIGNAVSQDNAKVAANAPFSVTQETKDVVAVSLGTVTAGIEKRFEVVLEFSEAIEGGQVAPSCGCIGVRPVALTDTSLQIVGALKVGTTSGSYKKRIDVTALSKADPANEFIRVIELTFDCKPAFNITTNAMTVPNNEASSVSIEIVDGTLTAAQMVEAPRLLGPWVKSTAWKHPQLHISIEPDSAGSDVVEHLLELTVSVDDKLNRLQFPIAIHRLPPFGPAFSEMLLSELSGGQFSASAWFKGLRHSPGTEVALEVHFGSADGLRKFGSILARSKVSPSGSLFTRIVVPSEIGEALRGESNSLATFSLDEQLFRIPVTVQRMGIE